MPVFARQKALFLAYYRIMNDPQRKKGAPVATNAPEPEKADEVPSPVEKKKGKQNGFNMKLPKVGPGNFWNNFLSALLLLLGLPSAYSYVVNRREVAEDISVSRIARPHFWQFHIEAV